MSCIDGTPRKTQRQMTGLAALCLAASALYAAVIRPWHLRWGASDEEIARTLPGDELVPKPRLNATHAITIAAPASAIWPWLVQIGQNRAGFYSYAWLENLVGCQMPTVTRIVPEWQNLKVGDKVWLHPKAPPLAVLDIDPGRAIVLEKCWILVLRPIDEYSTHLIVRNEGDFKPDFGHALLNFLFWRVVFEPAHFIMERKMLLTIKALAEGASSLQSP